MNPVTLLSLIATNPLSKRAIKKLLEKDGETLRLDKLLKAYGGGEDELKEKLRDAYWRRFTSVLQGIADFGIRKPQIPDVLLLPD
ncbi:MAG: hypothetical protein DRO98_04515 [Archaeoglobales archaeon]|nr:MAG: hypothetical protein DRO98_04515 [Archaeoglobales archaeon]